MIRRALIIYCDSTKSGELKGPIYDSINYKNLLKSKVGGEWYGSEIKLLDNPNTFEVMHAIRTFLSNAHYTFIIFSGHGFVDQYTKAQYLEFANGNFPITTLKTNAYRQTLIVDACRGYYQNANSLVQLYNKQYSSFTGIGDIEATTRQIFNNAVMKAEPGWTVLFAASEGQTAIDTNYGGAYLLSLLTVARIWETNDKTSNIVPLNVAHHYAKEVLYNNFDTIQKPAMNNQERRKYYFPLFVKQTYSNPHRQYSW